MRPNRWVARKAAAVAAALLTLGASLSGGLAAWADTDTDADRPAAAPVVHVVPGSNINLLARQSSIPITVENPTEAPVQVLVQAKTESFRLEVLADTTVEVPALSSVVAQLPVQAIANGPVTLRVWLTVDGEPVGEDYVVGVNVNYDVEVFLVVTFGVALFGLFVIGIFRTASKLRGRLGS